MVEHLLHQKENTITIHGVFGKGGSKTVLDATIDGERMALAIPNPTDDLETQMQKWSTVIQEPHSAELLSSLGLLTIPEYNLIPVTINNKEVQALGMTPFPDLPFTVFSGKDGGQTYTSGPLSDIEHFSDVIPHTDGIINDVATLARSGVMLYRDSISFAASPNESLRLFFYDLQGMSFDNTTPANELAERYASMIAFMLDNIFDFEQLQRFEKQGYDCCERNRLAKTVADNASQQL